MISWTRWYLLGTILLCGSPVVAGPDPVLFVDFGPDSSFPDWELDQYGPIEELSPLALFSAPELGVGFSASDTGLLQNHTLAILNDVFQDFSLQITNVRPQNPSFQTVGIDHVSAVGGQLFGMADTVDVAAIDMDYGRVFAGSFATFREFQQPVVDRWARAIGYTAAHEAAHNYGTIHDDAIPTDAEFAAGIRPWDHVMASSTSISMEQRATVNRFFGDVEYDRLAAALRPRAQNLATWHGWNANGQSANQFHVIVESASLDALTLAYDFQGATFGRPTIYSLPGPVKRWQIIWTGADVAPGTSFQAGIGLRETHDWKVVDTFLSDNGRRLDVTPPTISYRGVVDSEGNYAVELQNTATNGVVLRDLWLRQVPRMVDLDWMTPNEIDNPMSRPVGGWLDPQAARRQPVHTIAEYYSAADIVLGAGESLTVPIASLEEWVKNGACQGRANSGDSGDGDGNLDPEDSGQVQSVDLCMFPSTFVYGTTTLEWLDDLGSGTKNTTNLHFQIAGNSRRATLIEANLSPDMDVDAVDAAIMFGHWGTNHPLPDLYPDGIIDTADAAILFAAWTGDPVLHVPEPATILLALAALSVILPSRWQRIAL